MSRASFICRFCKKRVACMPICYDCQNRLQKNWDWLDREIKELEKKEPPDTKW